MRRAAEALTRAHASAPSRSGDAGDFSNLFMSIAEQMGVTLQNTAYSVNIKERLTSPARCSTPRAGWSPMRRTCRFISGRWTAR
jgi:hypothetical protein